MRKGFRFVLISFCAMFVSCSTGLSPREYGSTDYANLVFELYREEPSSDEPKRLSWPMRLGVAQIGEVAPHTTCVEELKKHPQLVSDVIEMPLPAQDRYRIQFGRRLPARERYGDEPESDLQLRTDALKRLGGDLGADYVFLFGGSVDTSSRTTGWSVFDLTLIGAWLVPSVIFKSEGKAAGALLDVEDGRVILLVNTERTMRGRAPTALARGRQEEVHVELRTELLKALSQELVEKMRQRG